MTLKPRPDAGAESSTVKSLSVEGNDFPWRRPRDDASNMPANEAPNNEYSGVPTHCGGESSAPPPGATNRGAVTSGPIDERQLDEDFSDGYDYDYSEVDEDTRSLCIHSDDDEDIDGEEFEPTVLYIYSQARCGRLRTWHR